MVKTAAKLFVKAQTVEGIAEVIFVKMRLNFMLTVLLIKIVVQVRIKIYPPFQKFISVLESRQFLCVLLLYIIQCNLKMKDILKSNYIYMFIF